jgi:predicted RNase H-like HicB family nuclease
MALTKKTQKFLDTVLKDYRIVLVYNSEELLKEHSGYPWFVYVQEWEGCMSDGRTPEEALEMIVDAAKGWRDCLVDNGIPVPPPSMADNSFYVWRELGTDWSGKKHG